MTHAVRACAADQYDLDFTCKCCGDRYTALDRRGYNQGFCRRCARRSFEEGQRAGALCRGAVRRGDLPHAKTLTCTDCAKPASEYEHRDYTKPLDVVPICRSCNLKRGRAYDSVWRPQEAA
jgi:hypothetical protein